MKQVTVSLSILVLQLTANFLLLASSDCFLSKKEKPHFAGVDYAARFYHTVVGGSISVIAGSISQCFSLERGC